MSFSYNQPWTTTRDYVRFLVGDTLSTNNIYSDEELDSLLLKWSDDARLAAAEAIEAYATQVARGAIRYSVTGFAMDRTKLVDALLATAARLREQAESVPFEFESIVTDYISQQGFDYSDYTVREFLDGPPGR